MKTELQKADFSDPEPAYEGMTDKQLQNRYKWFKRMCQPFLVLIVEKLAFLTKIFPEWTYKHFAKKTIYKFFVGGETLQECQSKIDLLGSKGVGSIPDLSVESASSEKKVDEAIVHILETINLAQRNRKKIPFTVFKVTGLIKKQLLISISGKLKAKQPLSYIEKKKFNVLLRRADSLCSAAYERDVRIMIDAEETWIQDAIDYIALTMMQRYNKDRVTVLNTYQMYLKGGLDHLKKDFNTATKEGFKLGAKVVRGAYMEKERERAIKLGYMSPINDTKEDTDNDYNKGLRFCIDNIDSIVLVAGTHNKDSIQYLMNAMEENGLANNSDNIHFSQLFGMGDILSYNLSKFGYNVCKYLPFGPVKDVVPYLTRRARENSSVNGFTSQELLTISKEIKRRGLLTGVM